MVFFNDAIETYSIFNGFLIEKLFQHDVTWHLHTDIVKYETW